MIEVRLETVAVKILEEIMFRQRWQTETRDKIADAIGEFHRQEVAAMEKKHLACVAKMSNKITHLIKKVKKLSAKPNKTKAKNPNDSSCASAPAKSGPPAP